MLKTKCQVRKIFSMNNPLEDKTGYDDPSIIRFDNVPSKLIIPPSSGLASYDQLITCDRVVGTSKMIEKQEKKLKGKAEPKKV